MLKKKKRPETSSLVRPHKIPPHLMELFQECCRKEEKAVLLWPDYMALSKAVFGRIEGDTFSFKNPSPLRESLMDPTITVSVTFSHLARVYAFVTWFVRLVQEEGKDGKEAHLFMRIPARIAVADSRSSCRVPICSEALLETKVIEEGGKVHKAKAVDICLTGILLQFEGDTPALDPKESVALELSLSEKKLIPLPKQEEDEKSGKEGGQGDGSGEDRKKPGDAEKEPPKFRVEIRPVEKPFRLEATLIRKEGKKLGFYFPGSLTPEGLNPPDTLKRVVKFLEMAYLRKRAEATSDDM